MSDIERNEAKVTKGILAPPSGKSLNLVFQKNGRIRISNDKMTKKRK